MFYNAIGVAVSTAEDKETGPEDPHSSGRGEIDEHNSGVRDDAYSVQHLHEGLDVRAVPADRHRPRLLDVHLHEELVRQGSASVCVATTELFGAVYPYLGPHHSARSAKPSIHTVGHL